MTGDCGCDECKAAKEVKEAATKAAGADASNDTTHITVTTADKQSVTIDMPMVEPKRVTVRKNSTVVEDRDFVSAYKEQANPTPAPEAKPVEKKEGEWFQKTTYLL